MDDHDMFEIICQNRDSPRRSAKICPKAQSCKEREASLINMKSKEDRREQIFRI